MRVWASVLLVVLLAPGLHAQYVYFSPDGSCSSDGMDCMSYHSVFHVFIRDAGPNTTGARFHLEVDEAATFGIGNVGEVSPREGVTIEEGDLFAGIVLSWPDGTFDGGFLDTLLTIEIDMDDPPLPGLYVITGGIELYSSSGEPAMLDDFMYYCSHCYMGGGWIEWQHPDTVDAVIGKSSVIDLPCIGYSLGGLSGTCLDAFDTAGWVDACTRCSVGIDCGPCPWDVQHVLIAITIPEGTMNGALDRIRVMPAGPCCLKDSTAVVVRAIPEIGTGEPSWGSIKSLLH